MLSRHTTNINEKTEPQQGELQQQHILKQTSHISDRQEPQGLRSGGSQIENLLSQLSPRARADHIAMGVPARSSTSMTQDPEQGTMIFNNKARLLMQAILLICKVLRARVVAMKATRQAATTVISTTEVMPKKQQKSWLAETTSVPSKPCKS